ncbi:DUF5684 domain-containing protein [Lujinxingia vulgaris]|nr:DUF5684 domain-containing protein [Lujinxingia vulgaris]
MLNALTSFALIAQAQPEFPIEDLIGSGVAMVILLISLVISLALLLVMAVSMWKIFTKAGQPGWMSLIPVLNVIILVQITGKEMWWVILLFVPIANLVATVIISLALAEAFGKDALWGLGLIFLPMIFLPMLAFGNAQYVRGGYARAGASF